MSLKEYSRKRSFDKTPEPEPRVQSTARAEITFASSATTPPDCITTFGWKWTGH